MKLEVFRSVRKNIILITILTVALFVSSQFVVMATVSTLGAELGEIRSEQEKYRLENELLRAEINAAKTTENIVEELDGKFEIVDSRAIELE